MPILVGTSLGGVGAIGPAPDLTDVTWTTATGRITRLSDWPSGYLVQPGARGLDMPAYVAYEDESPGIDGNYRRGTRATAREVMLPIAIYSDDGRIAFLARKRQLLRDMNPQLGRGTITLAEADGSARSIIAFYASGAEGDETEDAAGRTWTNYNLTFTCESPYWLGDPLRKTFRVAGGGSFFPSGVPWNVSDSQVLGDHVMMTNPGDVVAFPVWTINGPMTTATFTNNDTGETFTLTHTLVAGDTVVIDCRERVKTVLLNGTTNLWPDLDETATLFGLQPDVNDVSLDVSGTTSATQITLDLVPRYLSA